MHHGELFRLTAKIPNPAPDKQACHLRVGYAKWIRRTEFAEPHLRSSVNMMHAVASYLRRVIEVVITRRS